jgi:hypothetical protein
VLLDRKASKVLLAQMVKQCSAEPLTPLPLQAATEIFTSIHQRILYLVQRHQVLGQLVYRWLAHKDLQDLLDLGGMEWKFSHLLEILQYQMALLL